MRACSAATLVCGIALFGGGVTAQVVDAVTPVATQQEKVEPQFKEFIRVADEYPEAVWLIPDSWYSSFRLFAMEIVPSMEPGRSLRGVMVSDRADATCAWVYKGGMPLTQLLRHAAFTLTETDESVTVEERVTQVLRKQLDAMGATKDIVVVRAGALRTGPVLAMLQQRVKDAGGKLHVIELPLMEEVQSRGAARRAALEAGGTWQTLQTPASDELSLQKMVGRAHVIDEAQGLYQTTSLDGGEGFARRGVPIVFSQDRVLESKLFALSVVKSPDPVLRVEFDRLNAVQSAKLLNPPEELARIPQEVQELLLNSAYTWQRAQYGPSVVTLTYLVPGGGKQ
jgi:hypothetical protein